MSREERTAIITGMTPNSEPQGTPADRETVRERLRVTGVRQVALTVRDLEESARWYRDRFDLHEVFREEAPHRRAAGGVGAGRFALDSIRREPRRARPDSGRPAHPDSGEVLDPTVITGLRELDGTRMAQLVETFGGRIVACLERLRGGIDAADCALVATTCHTLSGTSSTLGAWSLAAVCGELEAAAVSHRAGRRSRDTSPLQAEADRVGPALGTAFPEQQVAAGPPETGSIRRRPRYHPLLPMPPSATLSSVVRGVAATARMRGAGGRDGRGEDA